MKFQKDYTGLLDTVHKNPDGTQVKFVVGKRITLW